MNALAHFQDRFAEAVFGDGNDFPPAAQAAFSVYRNTVMRACLDALEANYPAVVCLVGRDWFRAAAAEYATQNPPRDARLAIYGEDFAGFLAAFEPAAELIYLADVARLDRLWTESHVAADGGTLAAADVSSLTPDVLGALRLCPHPATRWLASPLPALSIWQASREGRPAPEDLCWQPEQALVARAGDEIRVLPVERAALRLLEHCAAGATLAEAADATLIVHPGARIDLILASLLRAGAFVTI